MSKNKIPVHVRNRPQILRPIAICYSLVFEDTVTPARKQQQPMLRILEQRERTFLKGAVHVIGKCEPGFLTLYLSEALFKLDLLTGCLFYSARLCFKPP